MIATRQTSLTGLPECLPDGDLIACFHGERAQMAVEREEPQPVIENHCVAVDAEIVREDYRARLCRFDRAQLERGKVVSEVRLVVDGLTFVGVGAAIGEGAERCRIRLTVKGAAPQWCRC